MFKKHQEIRKKSCIFTAVMKIVIIGSVNPHGYAGGPIFLWIISNFGELFLWIFSFFAELFVWIISFFLPLGDNAVRHVEIVPLYAISQING